MRPIEVKKEELLTILRANRDKHRQVFNAALEGWRNQAFHELSRLHDKLKAGKLPNLYVELSLPDHTRDYDRVITMVTMDIGTTFELSEADAKAYIMDDWSWKRQFLDSSNTYAAATVTQVYGEDAALEE
jgi:hypothetical protein